MSIVKNKTEINLTISKVVLVMISIIVSWWILVTVKFLDLHVILGSFNDFIDYKRLAEIAFIVLICKLYTNSLKISLKEMFTKINIKVLIMTLLFTAIYLFACSVVTHGKMCTFTLKNTQLSNICSLIYLGFFEEMAFRAWGYTAFYSVYKDNSKIRILKKIEVERRVLKACIMTNIFFALMHMQAYMMFYKYTSIFDYIINLLGVFIAGMFFTITFWKTKSIWNAVILHVFWDWFLSAMIF